MGNEARLAGYTVYKDPVVRAKIARLYGSGLSCAILLERFPRLSDTVLRSILKEYNIELRTRGRNYLANGGPV